MQLVWTVVNVVVVSIVALLVVYITCYFCMRRITTNLPLRNIENDCYPDSLQSMQFHSRNQIFHIHGRQDLDPPPSYEQVVQNQSTSMWQKQNIHFQNIHFQNKTNGNIQYCTIHIWTKYQLK